MRHVPSASNPDCVPDDGRREALRRLGRYALLLGLSSGAALLLSRRPEAGESCDRRFACRGCATLQGCGLSAATTYRRERKSGT